MSVVVASNTVVSDPACGRNLGHASWGVSVAGIIISILTIVIVVAVMVSAANDARNTVSSTSNPAPSYKTSCSYYKVGGSCYTTRIYYGSSVYYYCSNGYALSLIHI